MPVNTLVETPPLCRDTYNALFNVLRVHADGIKIIAESWHLLGAKAVAIWGQDKQLLACSPKSFAHTPAWTDGSEVTMWAPLVVKGQVVGQMGVLGLKGVCEQARLEASIALIAHLLELQLESEKMTAERIAQAKLRAELDLTASIQLQLLPKKLPAIAGLDIHAHSRPAEQVGGDFYTFTTHSTGHLVLTIGDVSGKGLPAALLMTMTRTVLHGVARFIPLLHPKAVLSRVNEDLYEDLTEVGMFVTMFASCYDPATRELTYANAGHSPVIYCPVDGHAHILKADGPAIGVLPLTQSENMVLSFGTGDILVLASDGLNEAHNSSGELFGFERLRTLIEELRHRSAKEIAETLFERITCFATGCDQFDDQTLIVVKGF